MNLTLTKWYTEENFAKLTKLAKFYLNSLSYTDTLKRLNGGSLLKRFIENMNHHNMKSAHRKIYLYSGHDKTVYSFLKANNITLSWMPDYGSSVIVEKLSDERNRVYVKVYNRIILRVNRKSEIYFQSFMLVFAATVVVRQPEKTDDFETGKLRRAVPTVGIFEDREALFAVQRRDEVPLQESRVR